MGGKLIIAGGNLSYCAAMIHRRLMEYAGGAYAKLAIIPTASGQDPASTIEYVKELWIKLGADPSNIIVLPVYGEEGKGWREPALGDEGSILNMLEGITGAWFTGGDQYYVHKAFVRKDGSDTKALEYLKKVFRNGGVIGGTSAGAAIMSEVMIASGDNATALSSPILYGYEGYDDSDESGEANLRIVKGLGFFTEGIIDQHFDKRPRLFRLIRSLTDYGSNLHMGYGVSEDTAMVYDRETKNITVLGRGGVYIIDCSKAEKARDIDSVTVKNVVVNVIKEGDLYNHLGNIFLFGDSQLGSKEGIS